MAPNRYYSNTAVATTLTAGVSDVATVLPVAATTGFPGSFPYTLILDEDTASEELVQVTSVSSLNLTVVRGVDGTTAVAHSSGATVHHGVSARDYAEPQSHLGATSSVHGLTTAVVGVGDAQTLTNKTISGASNTLSSIPATAVTGTASIVGHTHAESDVTNLVSDLASHTSSIGTNTSNISTNTASINTLNGYRTSPAGPGTPVASVTVNSGSPGPKNLCSTGFTPVSGGVYLIIASVDGYSTTGTGCRVKYSLTAATNPSDVVSTPIYNSVGGTAASAGGQVIGVWTPSSTAANTIYVQATWLTGGDTATFDTGTSVNIIRIY